MLRVSGESVDDVLDGPVVLNRCANIVMYQIAVKKNAVHLMYVRRYREKDNTFKRKGRIAERVCNNPLCVTIMCVIIHCWVFKV